MMFFITLNLFCAGNKDKTVLPASDVPQAIQEKMPEADPVQEENNSVQELTTEDPQQSSGETSITTDIPEILYVNDQHKFRLLEYDGEVLDVTFNKEGGIKTKVLAEGTRVVIKTFDPLMRVTETAVFTQDSGKNLLIGKTVFLFEEKSKFPSESTEINYTKNEKIVCLYNQSGFVLSIKYYSGNYALTSSQTGKDVLLKQEKFSYDSNNKVVEHIKKTVTEEVIRIYNYEKGLPNPDVKMFRNTVLREEIQYTDEENYMQTTYFDDNQSVVTLYSKGIKKEEVFKQGTKILRRTTY